MCLCPGFCQREGKPVIFLQGVVILFRMASNKKLRNEQSFATSEKGVGGLTAVTESQNVRGWKGPLWVI